MSKCYIVLYFYFIFYNVYFLTIHLVLSFAP